MAQPASTSGRFHATLGGQAVTVLPDPQQVNQQTDRGTLFGLTRHALGWIANRLKVAFNPQRTRTFNRYHEMQPASRLVSAAAARAHRDTAWPREAAHPDATLQAFRARDAQNAEAWYNAAIDLNTMRDKLGVRGKAASRFVKMGEDGRNPHYSQKEITGLYYKFMRVVEDGEQNGFRISTNTRHQDQVRRNYKTAMPVQERFGRALQTLRYEKGVFKDFLGPEGPGNLVQFAYHPTAYGDVKNIDRRQNSNRKTGEDKRAVGAQDIYHWAKMAAGTQPACVYPSWTQIAPADRITSSAAADAYFLTSAAVRGPRPTVADPNLQFFVANMQFFVSILFDTIVNTTGLQDGGNSKEFKAFVTKRPARLTPTWEKEHKNIQAWCWLLCEELADGAQFGYWVPQADGQTAAELMRHLPGCSLARVLHDDDDGHVTLIERFGAIQVALLCSKAIAYPFTNCVVDFLRLKDLIYEPLAYMETKKAHQASNKARSSARPQPGNTNPSDDDDNEDDDAPGPSGGAALATTNSGTKRRRGNASSTQTSTDATEPPSKRGRVEGAGDDTPTPAGNSGSKKQARRPRSKTKSATQRLSNTDAVNELQSEDEQSRQAGLKQRITAEDGSQTDAALLAGGYTFQLPAAPFQMPIPTRDFLAPSLPGSSSRVADNNINIPLNRVYANQHTRGVRFTAPMTPQSYERRAQPNEPAANSKSASIEPITAPMPALSSAPQPTYHQPVVAPSPAIDTTFIGPRLLDPQLNGGFNLEEPLGQNNAIPFEPTSDNAATPYDGFAGSEGIYPSYDQEVETGPSANAFHAPGAEDENAHINTGWQDGGSLAGYDDNSNDFTYAEYGNLHNTRTEVYAFDPVYYEPNTDAQAYTTYSYTTPEAAPQQQQEQQNKTDAVMMRQYTWLFEDIDEAQMVPTAMPSEELQHGITTNQHSASTQAREGSEYSAAATEALDRVWTEEEMDTSVLFWEEEAEKERERRNRGL